MREFELEVLNTGAGHLRLTFDPGVRAEVAKARRTVELMLRRGFALFVELEGGKLRPVKGFNASTGCYLVETVPDDAQVAKAEADAPALCACGRPARHRGAHRKRAELPASGTKAVAIGRSAGG